VSFLLILRGLNCFSNKPTVSASVRGRHQPRRLTHLHRLLSLTFTNLLSFTKSEEGSASVLPSPGVSCYTGESTIYSSENPSSSQRTFLAPPVPELNFFLLGKGEPGPGCGFITAARICDNPDCGKVHYVKAHCDRKACPDCYKRWISNEVDKAAARVLSREALNRHKGTRLVHIVLSPPESEKPATKKELDMLIHDGYEYIKEKGALGGLVVFHAFRVSEYAKEEARKEHMKHWAWIRKQKHPESYYRYSPHLHLIAFVNHLKPPEAGEKWVYKTIVNEKGQPVDFLRKAKREKELKGLIAYLLSHAVTIEGAEDSFHSLRWFGSCSYNQFQTTLEELESIEKPELEDKCHICGSPLVGIWKWKERWYYAARDGDIDKPKYWREIETALAGEPPPFGAEFYLLGKKK
jgi:Spore coat polysaccharide biosynthesis protein F, CMP-KDO synthetase homolog